VDVELRQATRRNGKVYPCTMMMLGLPLDSCSSSFESGEACSERQLIVLPDKQNVSVISETRPLLDLA
jgi:hypothetical protein